MWGRVLQLSGIWKGNFDDVGCSMECGIVSSALMPFSLDHVLEVTSSMTLGRGRVLASLLCSVFARMPRFALDSAAVIASDGGPGQHELDERAARFGHFGRWYRHQHC